MVPDQAADVIVVGAGNAAFCAALAAQEHGAEVVMLEAAVFDTDQQPIRGLDTAGEKLVGGLFYFNYPGGTGLLSGAAFGMIAGSSAARDTSVGGK
jgi:succinate dehydrogenase/fumarate reductase flavoprotein subunit